MNNIPNFATVDTNIYRGGQPDAQGWEYLEELGVTRVAKLNMDSEAKDETNLEILKAGIPLDEQLIFMPDKQVVQTAVDFIIPGTFIHCEHGQDRTGLIIGCYRVWTQGWDKEKAWQEMLDRGFHEALLGLTLFWKWAV